MLLRTKYLEKIRPYYHSDLIKVISGVRRCGKSTLMKQIMNELAATVPDDHIISVNLEDYSYAPYLENPGAFHDTITARMDGKGMYYLFMDEIQNLKDFQRVIASFKATATCSLFVTGSNSRLLSGELSSLLTGRTVDFRIMPFSYQETVQYLQEKGQEISDETFTEYLRWGGIPLRFSFPEPSNQQDLIKSLYEGIVERDIFYRQTITNRTGFRNFASFILSLSGSTVSASSIAGYVSAKEEKMSRTTVYAYLDYLEQAYLVTKVPRFDIMGKKALATLQKYYAIDPGFITINRGGALDNLGTVLETIVYNELLSRGYDVFIGKLRNAEVDFIVRKGNQTCYIQVAYLLAEEHTIEREFGAYKPIKDNFPKYVLSLDRIDLSRDGIIHLNIADFLLEKNQLMFL